MFFSYDFHFIDVKRGSYGEAKRRVGVVMFAWLTWIDRAGVVKRFPEVPLFSRLLCCRLTERLAFDGTRPRGRQFQAVSRQK